MYAIDEYFDELENTNNITFHNVYCILIVYIIDFMLEKLSTFSD